MSKIDVTSKIERLEVFEERMGVTFKSLSAFLDADDDDYLMVEVRGEIHASTGTKLKDDLTVMIAVYDRSDRVVGTGYCNYYKDDFFGFDTFSESVNISVKDISKIRIHPKKG